MIIKEVRNILGQPLYIVSSDKGVYIKKLNDGTLWTTCNSSIDFEFEETDIIIDEEIGIFENGGNNDTSN